MRWVDVILVTTMLYIESIYIYNILYDRECLLSPTYSHCMTECDKGVVCITMTLRTCTCIN